MNIHKWFIKPDELNKIEHAYLLHITAELMNEFETDDNKHYWKYRPIHDIRTRLLDKYRISQDTFIVLYTHDELMSAARFAWLLHWIGCEHIRILIGHADCSLNTSHRSESSSTVYLPCRPVRPDIVMTCDDLFDAFTCTMNTFVDVRTYDEYIGRITGYPFVRYAGRIPHFLFDPMNGLYGDLQGTIDWQTLETSIDLMKTIYEQHIPRTARLIFVCGTGWRASLSAIFADILELADRISVVDSGWYEWSERFIHYV
jgi:molybdopterin synthase sulfurtransferase